MSYISVLAGEYHLSIRKIQRLLRAQYGVTFSVGAISEAQGRISSILTPTHHALKRHIQKAKVIHADETSHQRNGESNTRWLWLMASSDAVFQNIRCFRSQDNAKHLLGEASHGVVVTDQCASYNWLDPTRHQFCLAHVQRNLQEMAGIWRWTNGLPWCRLVLLFKSVFRTQHSYEGEQPVEPLWFDVLRLRRSIRALWTRGYGVRRYAGRCQHIPGHEAGRGCFYSTGERHDQ